MSSVKLVRDTYIQVTHRGYDILLGVRVKDIGCTIGTELFWLESGERIATYKPGTRYGDYAEELAADLVKKAANEVADWHSYSAFRKALVDAVQTLVSKEQPWGPDNEDDEESW